MSGNKVLRQSPSVHVLLAAYEGERFISAQIESILKQKTTHQLDIKLSIATEPCDDTTREIVDKFVSYGKVDHIAPSHRSGSAKRNFSSLMETALATDSRYFALADQDDVWDSDKIVKSSRLMWNIERTVGERTPILVFTDSRVVREDLSLISHSFWNHEVLDPMACKNYKKIAFQNVGQGCTFYFNRALLELATPVPEEARMHDHWLMLVASVFGVAACLQETTMSYRQHLTNVVGAEGHSFSKVIRRVICKSHTIRSAITASVEQADALLRRYQNRLSDEQKNFFLGVSTLKQTSSLKRRIFLFENRIAMSTLDRTIGLYLFI